MAVGDICTRDVVIVEKAATIQQAAQLMREHHVGCLVITQDFAGKQSPKGIITDRDIVLSVVAPGLDPSVFTVGDLANDTPTTIDEKKGISDAIEQMRKSGIRRMPVVGPSGRLVGILAVDDLLQLLAEEFGHIAALIAREQKQERRMRV